MHQDLHHARGETTQRCQTQTVPHVFPQRAHVNKVSPHTKFAHPGLETVNHHCRWLFAGQSNPSYTHNHAADRHSTKRSNRHAALPLSNNCPQESLFACSEPGMLDCSTPRCLSRTRWCSLRRRIADACLRFPMVVKLHHGGSGEALGRLWMSPVAEASKNIHCG